MLFMVIIFQRRGKKWVYKIILQTTESTTGFLFQCPDADLDYGRQTDRKGWRAFYVFIWSQTRVQWEAMFFNDNVTCCAINHTHNLTSKSKSCPLHLWPWQTSSRCSHVCCLCISLFHYFSSIITEGQHTTSAWVESDTCSCWATQNFTGSPDVFLCVCVCVQMLSCAEMWMWVCRL